MKKVRTIVVDDEPLARLRIVKLLGNFDYISLVKECKNGSEAISCIKRYKPDLVFLDVQMPDFNGFDVLAELDKDEANLPFIVFVTAYDQYALKAFDVHAVDYLLKPFDDERFEQALVHARQHIQLMEDQKLHTRMKKLLSEFELNQEGTLNYLEIKDKGRINRINLYDVFWFEAHGNYVKLHLKNTMFLFRQTLQALEEQLDKKTFLRIHRSIVINTNFQEKIRYKGNNRYLFELQNGEELLSGRSYKEEIDQYLENCD